MTELIDRIRCAFYVRLRSWLKIKYTYHADRNARIVGPAPPPAGKQAVVPQESNQGG